MVPINLKQTAIIAAERKGISVAEAEKDLDELKSRSNGSQFKLELLVRNYMETPAGQKKSSSTEEVKA